MDEVNGVKVIVALEEQFENLFKNANFIQESENSKRSFINIKQLIYTSVQKTYNDFCILSELLLRKSDFERKCEIVKFVTNCRKLYLRLIALLRWLMSVEHFEELQLASLIVNYHNNLFRMIADSLYNVAYQFLPLSKIPLLSLPITIEIMSTNSYTRQSLSIKTKCIKNRSQLDDMTLNQTKQDINVILIERLCQCRDIFENEVDLFTSIQIESGCLIMEVADQFQVSLSAYSSDLCHPWRVVGLQFFINDSLSMFDGQSFIHSSQIEKMKRVLEKILSSNNNQLIPLYNYLNQFTFYIMLDVLYTQTYFSIQEGSLNRIQIHEYLEGKSLSVTFWNSISNECTSNKEDKSSEHRATKDFENRNRFTITFQPKPHSNSHYCLMLHEEFYEIHYDKQTTSDINVIAKCSLSRCSSHIILKKTNMKSIINYCMRNKINHMIRTLHDKFINQQLWPIDSIKMTGYDLKLHIDDTEFHSIIMSVNKSNGSWLVKCSSWPELLNNHPNLIKIINYNEAENFEYNHFWKNLRLELHLKRIQHLMTEQFKWNFVVWPFKYLNDLVTVHFQADLDFVSDKILVATSKYLNSFSYIHHESLINTSIQSLVFIPKILGNSNYESYQNMNLQIYLIEWQPTSILQMNRLFECHFNDTSPKITSIYFINEHLLTDDNMLNKMDSLCNIGHSFDNNFIIMPFLIKMISQGMLFSIESSEINKLATLNEMNNNTSIVLSKHKFNRNEDKSLKIIIYSLSNQIMNRLNTKLFILNSIQIQSLHWSSNKFIVLFSYTTLFGSFHENHLIQCSNLNEYYLSSFVNNFVSSINMIQQLFFTFYASSHKTDTHIDIVVNYGSYLALKCSNELQVIVEWDNQGLRYGLIFLDTLNYSFFFNSTLLKKINQKFDSIRDLKWLIKYLRQVKTLLTRLMSLPHNVLCAVGAKSQILTLNFNLIIKSITSFRLIYRHYVIMDINIRDDGCIDIRDASTLNCSQGRLFSGLFPMVGLNNLLNIRNTNYLVASTTVGSSISVDLSSYFRLFEIPTDFNDDHSLTILERYFGCIYLLKHIIRICKLDEQQLLASNKDQLVIYSKDDFNIILTTNKLHTEYPRPCLLFEMTKSATEERISNEDLKIASLFFDCWVLKAPYKLSNVMVFFGILTCPTNILIDFLKIFKIQMNNEKSQIGWKLRISSTAPSHLPSIAAGGSPFVMVKNRIFFVVEFWKEIHQPNDSHINQEKTIVDQKIENSICKIIDSIHVAFVYDQNNNTTGDLQLISSLRHRSNQLKISINETSMFLIIRNIQASLRLINEKATKTGICSIFPSIQVFLNDLVI